MIHWSWLLLTFSVAFSVGCAYGFHVGREFQQVGAHLLEHFNRYRHGSTEL